MNMWVAFISSAIPLGVPLLYGSTGEIVTEKSGHLNLGIPGIMYVGSIGGVIVIIAAVYSIFASMKLRKAWKEYQQTGSFTV